MRFYAILTKFARDRGGATATEYALLIALVAGLSIAVWTGIGDSLSKIFQYITNALV
jgi:Flp pilus assembly pilin Flp